MKILIADDEVLWANLIKGILEGHNYQVVITLKGKEVSDLAYRENVDMVLLDVNFPDGNGFDICHQIKSNVHTEDIPVILLTAQSDPSDLKRGLEFGASDYVEKHSSSLELLARVQAVLRQRQKTNILYNYKNIVENSLYLIALISGDKFIFANRKFLGTFGFADLNEIIQIEYKNTIADDDVNTIQSMINEVMQTDEIKHLNYRGKKKSGEIINLKAGINRIKIISDFVIALYCKVV